MGGLTTPAVLADSDLEIIGLYLDLDGSFPNHPPNPLEPANLVDAQAGGARARRRPGGGVRR